MDIGNVKIDAMFIGNIPVAKIFLGNIEVFANNLAQPLLILGEDGHTLTLIAKDFSTQSFDLYANDVFKYNIPLN